MFKEIFFDFLHMPTKYRSSPLHKLFKILLIVCFAILISESSIQAHPGRTDSNGGHHVRATGEYHYHHGYSAHQHPNGVCPYRTTNNSSNDSDRIIIIVFISILGVCVVSSCVKTIYDEIQKRKQFKKEKLHYLNLYTMN